MIHWQSDGGHGLSLPPFPALADKQPAAPGVTSPLPVAAGIHDPTPAENNQDRPINQHNGPRDFEAGWLKFHDSGADGLYLFNNETGWNTQRRMGHIDEVRKRVQSGTVHGMIEGPSITFADQKVTTDR